MKKRSILKALLLVLLSCLLAVALVACGGKHTVTYVYTGVDANADGQDDTVTVEVSDGAKLEKPADPTRDGYTFAGWSDGTGIWDFQTDTVTGDITLTARWSAGGDPSTGELDSSVHVYFDLQGNIENGTPSEGEVPTSQTVATGSEITLPAAPAAASGYTFAGWLVDGETELRAAGSKYTVSATVTIRAQWTTLTKVTAKWDAEGVFDFDGEAITLTVNKDLVGTYQPTEEQGGGDTVTFTVKKEELQAAADALIAALKAGEFPTTAVPGAFHVTQKDPTCTEGGKAAVVYTANAVSGSFYAQDAIEAYAEDIPASGHDYQWDYPADIGDTLTYGESANITGVCSRCGDQQAVTLPAINPTPESTNAFFDPDGTWPQGFPEKAESAIGVGEYFITSFQTPGCETEGFVSGKYKASETLWVEFDNITFSPLGHNFSSSAEWDSDNHCYVAACENSCGAQYTLSVVFEKGTLSGEGEITGEVDVSNWSVTFDGETKTFSFKTPETCPLTAPTGNFFDGWKSGDALYGNNATVTVAATEGSASIVLTAQWTAEHTHRYDANPRYNKETGKVDVDCSLCTSETEGHTKSYDITGISIDDPDKPTAFTVTDTAVGTPVTLPDGFAVTARGDWEDTVTQDVTISEGLTAAIKTNAYKNSVVTVTLKDGITAELTGVTLYKQKVESGNKTYTAYAWNGVDLGTYTGEFELRFTLSNIQRGDASYQSWVLSFDVNGSTAVMREDNWLNENFGRAYTLSDDTTGNGHFAGDVDLGKGASANPNDGAYANKLKQSNTLHFVVTRTYSEGTYTLITTISTDNDYSIVLSLVEPETTQNTITVYLGGESASYDYSAVEFVEKGLTLSSIKATAETVSVAYGTALANVPVTLELTYDGSTLKDVVTSGYTLECAEYEATTPSTYTVTVNYQGKSTTVKVTVAARVVVTKVAEYKVNADGNAFTDGSAFSSTDGAFANSAFTPNKTIDVSGNPFNGVEVDPNGGITIDLVVYGTNTVGAWAPIVSFVNAGNGENRGFVSIVAEGSAGAFGVHINDMAGNYVDYANIGTLKADGQTRITVSIANNGTVSIFVDGTAVTLTAEVTGTLSNVVSQMTASEGGFTDMYFTYREHAWWTGAFTGGIVSCTLYNGTFSTADFQA